MTRIEPTQAQLERLKEAFREVKAENDMLLHRPDSNTFVHTEVYKKVRHSRQPLLIGRKGSGKTALLLGYEHEQRNDYLATATIDIVADDFPVQTLFEFFYTDYKRSMDLVASRARRISDLPGFVDPARVSAFAWLQSLMSAAIYITAGALLADESIVLPEDHRSKLRKSRNAISKYMGKKRILARDEDSGGEAVFTLLVYFFQTVQGAIDKVLDTHTGEIAVLLAAITRATTKTLTSRLDKKIEEAAAIINHVYETHQRRTLITLDKFDDFYDDFYRHVRREAEEKDRRQFLAALLQGLVIATRDLNRDPRFRWLDTLFAVPMDKFLELHLRERSDLEYSQVIRLDWTPAELLEYVNRRIAYALELSDAETQTAWKLLFPFEVTNGRIKEVKEDSFLYIVRHTLWRPREVQMYLNALFLEMEKTRRPADEEMFRKVIQSESERIIRREFFEEFLAEYPGMPRVLKKLENVELRNVMPYEEVCDKLAGISLYPELSKPDEIMLRLFHMGVLGVRQVFAAKRAEHSDATITQNKEEVSYRFSYNCDVNDPFTQGINVVFHPMFFEYLNIKPATEKYVVNQLTWEMFGITG